MSVKVMTAVWEESVHKGAALLIMLALADHANDEGVSWPGLERLAQRARVSDRQAQAISTALIASGELHTLRNAGRGHTNLYLVTIGHTAQSLMNVLVQRFNMGPEEARRMTYAILAKRKAGKGEAGNTFSSANGEVSSGKGEVQRGKGEVFGIKGEVATSPEPINRQLTLTEPNIEPTIDDATEKARQTWEVARSHMRLQLPQSTYDTWVRDTRVLKATGDAYFIACPNQYARDWLKLRLERLIKSTLVSICGRPVTVEFVTAAPVPANTEE